MDTNQPTTIVLGAGVVGLSTALYLQRSGHHVTVIDPLPPAGGASYGNGGLISSDTAVPIALPGMLHKVPGWLTDREGPLAVRPSYFPARCPGCCGGSRPAACRACSRSPTRCARCIGRHSPAGANCSTPISMPT